MTDTPPQQPIHVAASPEQPIHVVVSKPKKVWYKKKRIMIPLAIFVLIVISSAAGGGDDSSSKPVAASVSASSNKTATTVASALYPNRIDRQTKDKEVVLGQSADISGYTVTADAQFQQSVSSIDKDGYVVADITLKNRDTKAQSYNPYDYRLQTPNGQVLDSDFTIMDDALHSGDLVQGGTVTGKVAFEVGTVKGDYYLIYKPDAFNADRVIWQVTVK